MKRVGIILTDAVTVIGVCLAILFLLFYVSGKKPYIVLSGSMESAIHTGSICVVNEKVPYVHIGKDDVIAFREGKMQVMHRVLKVHAEGLETKGDANNVSDGITTTPENYMGKVMFSIPYVGYILRFLYTKTGMIISVTIIIAAIICSELLKENKKGKEEDI